MAGKMVVPEADAFKVGVPWGRAAAPLEGRLIWG